MPHEIEKRESRRSSYAADVEVEWGSSILRARTRNLSLGGTLLGMTNPLWMNAEFDARVTLPDGPIKARCIVRRVVAGEGIGVEFLEMSPGDLGRLRLLLERLPY